MVRSAPTGRRLSCDGYTLVALVVMVAVMGIATAITLPLWSSVIQREKERQLIFRGAQYAEAIRVFQSRTGRLPVKLEELLEVEPRSIRQLWDDPMTDNGRWDLIRKAGQGGAPGQGDGAPIRSGSEEGVSEAQRDGSAGEDPFALEGSGPGADAAGGLRGSGDGKEVNIGPIAGVRSRSSDSGFRLFLDQEEYSQWEFTPDLFPPIVGADGRPHTPHLGTDWIGRPLPKPKVEEGDTPEDRFGEALDGLEDEATP